jgi:hypothetical protein
MSIPSRSSTRFAPPVGMTTTSHVIRRLGDIVGRVLPRVAALIIGFILMTVGLGMTITVVLLPVGIVSGLLGVAIFVGGLFAPDVREERR